MLEFAKEIIRETIWVFNEAAIYILFGFFIAGILYIFYPKEKVVKALGKEGFGSILKAAFIGIPLPLCSCGVIPTAFSLRKQGASRGATLSFLISTPETGVDSLAITYALLDPIMTVFRPFAAFLTAIFAGLAENVFASHDDYPIAELNNCSTCNNSDADGHTHNKKVKFKRAMEYAFVDLVGDISKTLVIGIVLAGIISTVIPKGFFENYLGSGILSMLIMLVVGIPLYICATASTPIASALILKGLSPGAALVLLLAGPATNIATILVVGKQMGRKTVIVYLISIALMSILMGVLLNQVYFYLGFNAIASVGEAKELIPEILKIAGSVILAGLIIYNWGKRKSC
jgi:uncharacterized membrane protein YraQ (UPF0718 family)